MCIINKEENITPFNAELHASIKDKKYPPG